MPRLGDDEYKAELQKKLGEELQEYIQASDQKSAVEELADLMELVYAAAEMHGSSVAELERVRLQKVEDRGAFMDKIFLIEVNDA